MSNILWLIFGLVLVMLTPWIPALLGKYLHPRRGLGVREEALEHAITPEFATDVSESLKNTVLHGLAYPHGGVMDRTTRKLIAQRQTSPYN